MDERVLIDALGGTRRLADSLGIGRSAASNWPKRGIPAHAWPAVLELARARGLEITPALHATMVAASKRAMRRPDRRDRQPEPAS